VLFGIGGPKKFGDTGPNPMWTVECMPLEFYCPTHVIEPNFWD